MDRMVLLLLSQLWVMGAMSRRPVKYISESKTWHEAQAYCRQNHVDMVTIRTGADYDGITEDSWVGIRRENSTADFKWSQADEPLTYDPPWDNDDPEDGKDCVKYDEGHQEWKSEDCTNSKDFYCSQEPLYLVKERKTWEEALAHCRAMEGADPTAYNMHTYDLATLLTDEDHAIAKELIQMAETDRVWTGLRFLGDRWMWVSGEEVQYTDINTCPTINRCGALHKNSSDLYHIRKCNETKNFLCYKKTAAA